MNRVIIPILIMGIIGCSDPKTDTAWIPPSPSNVIDGVKYVSGNWKPHLAAGDKGLSWGNHRAVVHVENPTANSIRVEIPWRRLDADPEEKAIVIEDSTSGEPIPNALARDVTAESGTVLFEPNRESGTYYVYFLPWESTGGYYPRSTYPDSVWEPDAEWAPGNDAVEGTTVRLESVNDFHSFFPMEIPATESETETFIEGRDWVVIPEFGRYPISMRHNVPVHWTSRTSEDFTTRAYRDESHAFQLGVFAASTALEDVDVQFSDFPDELMNTLTCYNCDGVSFTNEAFSKEISVPSGDVQPLWIGVHIPADMEGGTYSGQATVSTSNAGSKTVEITIEVLPSLITNQGYDDPASQSRLAWLNSQAGRDADFIIDPYLPVTAQGQTLSILGRDVELGSTGLPAAITSYFTEEMTSVSDAGAPILAEPLMLFVQAGPGSEQWQPADFEIVNAGRGRAEWVTDSQSENFNLRVEGALEYDGMLDYRITLTAEYDIEVQNITLPITYASDAATWLLGLGHKGQKRPASIDWKWKVENHQEGVWMGAVNKGLQYVLRDDNYERPLNTNFYQNQPLNMPISWENEGKGGIRMVETARGITMENYSGSRSMKAGEELHFNVRFLITPFKHLDTQTHFNTRFVHKYVPVDSVVAWGGTVVNIHHANEINPYINYPFFNLEDAKAYIDEAHEKGIKVKLYNTIRELTYKAYELQAMRSLGEEIFNGGEGGGHSWMQEHLRENYHSAWHAWRVDDAALLNKGTSRWTNYYIEGLSWLAANQEMDGLYLDDIAFSRETVKRMISVLHAERDEVVIDLHSANQFNPADGYINSAMLYMEHFPFISRLWFGEYFDYDQRGDYWMTEVSGLPFGLMGEMLQGGGHPYRGMLYGMTTRMYGDVDPRPVWKMMNDFVIAESRMLGYWLTDAPVDTGNDLVKGSAFVREDGSVLIALASWSDQDLQIDLTLNMERLGLDSGFSFEVPTVEGLQDAHQYGADESVTVPANMGLYLIAN